MKTRNALLIIDAQNDFCDPEGALSVPGAVADAERLKQFIGDRQDEIDHICLTLDSHPVHDISHPSFWKDQDGNPPAPFTGITAADAQAGKWQPRFEAERAKAYLEKLERQGEFPHVIWPYHCLTGSWGHSLFPPILAAVIAWSKARGRDYQTEMKGTYPLTEHFGIFQAQIPVTEHPETQRNQRLLDELIRFDRVYLAGQAKSHCVAASLRQIMDFAPALARKLVVLENTMSDVPNMGHLGEPVYERARAENVLFETV